MTLYHSQMQFHMINDITLLDGTSHSIFFFNFIYRVELGKQLAKVIQPELAGTKMSVHMTRQPLVLSTSSNLTRNNSYTV